MTELVWEGKQKMTRKSPGADRTAVSDDRDPEQNWARATEIALRRFELREHDFGCNDLPAANCVFHFFPDARESVVRVHSKAGIK